MADPVNYCSWLYDSFCITQSEWATWTQAGLTVTTFAIALVRQHSVEKNAALQKQASDAALLQERKEHADQQRIANEQLLAETRFNRALRAKAIAVSLKPELNRFHSALRVYLEHGIPDTPQLALDGISPSLEIRHWARDALELGDSAEITLEVIEAATTLYEYLRAVVQSGESFSPNHHEYMESICRDAMPRVVEAINSTLAIVYRPVER